MNIESFVKTLAELRPVDNLSRNMYYGDTMGAKDRCDNLLYWNIYPFHPSTVESAYFSSDDRPNRKPTRVECEFGKRVLSILLGCFNINEIYAIGRIPEMVLKNECTDIKYIRHPSRGGANEFRKGFNEIYKIEDLN